MGRRKSPLVSACFKMTRAGSGVPVFSILGSCSVAVFVALINFSDTLRPKDVLDVLMNTTGMIALLVYLVIAFSQLRMRRKLIAEGKEIPDGSLVMGSPGKVVRELSEAQKKMLEGSAAHYVHNAQRYARDLALDE